MILYSAFLPTHHLEDFEPDIDYHFLEPNPDPYYVAYYNNLITSKHVHLDNGLIEYKRPPDIDVLVEYADRVRPDCVTAPDKLGDWKFNFDMAIALKQVQKPWSVQVVAGGPRPFDFEVQAQMANNHNLHIALPYRLNRVWDFNWPHNNVHLFGCRMPEDLSMFPDGTTYDTVEPISAAYWGFNYLETGLRTVPRPPEYQDVRLTPDQVRLAKSNIAVFKRWLNRGAPYES